MKIYDYWRSSAAYRVRIGLNLKGLSHESLPVHLTRQGGEHLSDNYKAVNPQQLVPTLLDRDQRLIQSLAILEYLEEIQPDPAILPADPVGRARVRALAQIVACDIHPLNNLRVLNYLRNIFHFTDEQRNQWYAHWIDRGFAAIESLLQDEIPDGDFCHGNQPGMADICLVPQVYNARRFHVDMSAYPRINKVTAACNRLPAFIKAMPEHHPHAEE